MVLADEIRMFFFSRVLFRRFSPKKQISSVKDLHQSTFGFVKLSRTMSGQIELFQSIGLAEQKAKETAKNKNLADRLESLIKTTVRIDSFYILSY